jgi:hypothetical protein
MIPTLDPVIASLAKDSDMGCKPIFESTADVPEPAIVRDVRRYIIEPLIHLWKARVDGVSSRAGENAPRSGDHPTRCAWVICGHSGVDHVNSF